MTHPLYLPELLENIFSFLAKDKALYPALFVNSLWYHCSARILWQRVEIFTEDYRNMSQALSLRLKKIKRVMRGKIKPLYCSKMVYLRLEGLKISDALLSTILRSCPNIRFLILDQSRGFTIIPIIEIAKFSPKLQHLSLNSCKCVSDRCISEIARSCSNLKFLDIASLYSDTYISDASIIEIARYCPNLVYLNLTSHGGITDASICAIARSCGKLQHLDLTFNEKITDEAICAIASGCPDMRSYFLEGCERITDKSIKKIAQLNHNLQNIVLNSCYEITDDGVCDIVRLCPNIRGISLQFIFITDKTIYEIARSCPNLLVLNAKKCPCVSDESIYFLLSKKPTLDIILDWIP